MNAPKDPDFQYNKEEKQVMRAARAFEDMVSTDGWKHFVSTLEAQIAERMQIIQTPLHALPGPQFANMDMMGRATALESVKGAVIGLRLALSLPSATMNHAKQIVVDHSKPQAPLAEGTKQ